MKETPDTPSRKERSYRPGPYEVVFLDTQDTVGPKLFEPWMNEQTHFVWWGPEAARVGDWCRFDLPNAPFVQIKKQCLCWESSLK